MRTQIAVDWQTLSVLNQGKAVVYMKIADHVQKQPLLIHPNLNTVQSTMTAVLSRVIN